MSAATSRIMLKVPIEVDRDHLLEIGERHRSVAADDALGRPDAGAIDQDARRAVLLACRPSASAFTASSAIW